MSEQAKVGKIYFDQLTTTTINGHDCAISEKALAELARLRAEVEKLSAENERLRGIVEKLPVTKDGATVIPGENVVWHPNYDCPLRMTTCTYAEPVYRSGFQKPTTEKIIDCYSTEAAALAAKGGM